MEASSDCARAKSVATVGLPRAASIRLISACWMPPSPPRWSASPCLTSSAGSHTAATGLKQRDLRYHTVELSAFGHCCRCIELPSLIRVKRAAGRPKDLEAIAELEALLDER